MRFDLQASVPVHGDIVAFSNSVANHESTELASLLKAVREEAPGKIKGGLRAVYRTLALTGHFSAGTANTCV